MESNFRVKALVFDAYGTLFDTESVSARIQEIYSERGAGLSRLWRTKQLEYTWLRSLMERYEDFWRVTEDALVFSAKSLGLDCGEAVRARLMNEYLLLKPYPEAAGALQSLSRCPLAILSNGTAEMLDAVVTHARLDAVFTQLISVDEVKVYKPDPRVYELAPRKLGVEKREIGFVSSNCWDVMGAKSFGFATIWVNRSNASADELGLAPDVEIITLADLPACLG